MDVFIEIRNFAKFNSVVVGSRFVFLKAIIGFGPALKNNMDPQPKEKFGEFQTFSVS